MESALLSNTRWVAAAHFGMILVISSDVELWQMLTIHLDEFHRYEGCGARHGGLPCTKPASVTP